MASTVNEDRVADFSLGEARRIVGDLFRPNPRVYWVDWGLTIGIGHTLFLLVAFLPALLPEPVWLVWLLRGAGFLVASLLYYRSAMFIHELVHLRGDEFRGFRFLWNWLSGCTFLMPTFVYYTHLDHHRRRHFGTPQDGEYIPLACRPRYHILLYMALPLVIPVAAVFRFLVLTPLAWLSPGIRRQVHERASSMVMEPNYIRPLPTKGMMRIIVVQEVTCFIWLVVAFLLMCTVLREWAGALLLEAYLAGVVILVLNSVRTLGAHRFTNSGDQMTFVEQMLDSANYPRGGVMPEIWAPIGTRYHALHHLFPSLPYHHLGEAHRRLIRDLPADSAYRLTNETSLYAALRTLWRRAGGGRVET